MTDVECPRCLSGAGQPCVRMVGGRPKLATEPCVARLVAAMKAALPARRRRAA